MKKNHIKPPRLFVTSFMKESWESFVGKRRMPRSPHKFLRIFLQLTEMELDDMSYVFKGIIVERVAAGPFMLPVIYTEAEWIEKTLSRLIDECCTSRKRYYAKMERYIERSYRYGTLAKQASVYIKTTEAVKSIALEQLYTESLQWALFDDIVDLAEEETIFN
jgi:hypothetical protein